MKKIIIVCLVLGTSSILSAQSKFSFDANFSVGGNKLTKVKHDWYGKLGAIGSSMGSGIMVNYRFLKVNSVGFLLSTGYGEYMATNTLQGGFNWDISSIVVQNYDVIPIKLSMVNKLSDHFSYYASYGALPVVKSKISVDGFEDTGFKKNKMLGYMAFGTIINMGRVSFINSVEFYRTLFRNKSDLRTNSMMLSLGMRYHLGFKKSKN